VQELAPGIVIFENIFSESYDKIKLIEELSESLWQPAKVLDSNSTSGETLVDYKTRNVDTIRLVEDLSPDLSSFKNDFLDAIKDPVREYLDYYGVSVTSSEPPRLLRYGIDQHVINHIDDTPHAMDSVRRVSIVYYANDDYSGGEIEFSRFGLKLAPRKSSLLIFPSTYVYNHMVHKVTDGFRYSVVRWLS
jgi:predicted 2-oxoglutarate/Fe(II)-dependent dioxygenase YbiX